MSGPHAQLANDVDANIRGGEAAKESIARIASGASVPDELFHSLAQVTKNWNEAGARGFLREVGKTIERQIA